MSKFYFETQESEMCYTIDLFHDLMQINGKSEMTVYEAKPLLGSGFFWCPEYSFAGEAGDGNCGKVCDRYAPINGKTGRCRHSKPTYTPGQRVKIKLPMLMMPRYIP